MPQPLHEIAVAGEGALVHYNYGMLPHVDLS